MLPERCLGFTVGPKAVAGEHGLYGDGEAVGPDDGVIAAAPMGMREAMGSDQTTVVYIRRDADESLRRVIGLAETYYERGLWDFVVLDMSGDRTAMTVLGTAGDPVRYLTVPVSDDIPTTLACVPGLTDAREVIVIGEEELHRIPAMAEVEAASVVPAPVPASAG